MRQKDRKTFSAPTVEERRDALGQEPISEPGLKAAAAGQQAEVERKRRRRRASGRRVPRVPV